jgi:hypothetical protein
VIGAQPDDAPEEIPPLPPAVPDHYLHGAATGVVRYGYAFAVAAYGSHTEQLTWREGRWTFKPYPAPRPIYGRELLVKRPTDPVLVVDDEDNAHVARVLLPPYVVVSWAGGESCLMDNDWSVLKGRDVILWPDAGRFHVKLVELLLLTTSRLRIVTAADEAAFVNIAAAQAQGLSAEAVVKYATEHLIAAEDFKPPVIEAREATSQLLDPAHWEWVLRMGWEAFTVDLNRSGVPHGNVANVAKLLRGGSDTLSYDEFTGRVMERLGTKHRYWSAQDTLDLSVLMQARLRAPTFSASVVAQGVLWAARRVPRHTLREWLESLTWDRTERLAHWLADIFSVEKTPYTEAVAKNWLTAMVARAFEPGCSMPAMLILEGLAPNLGAEALGKLASPWNGAFNANDEDLGRKIKGHWLVVLPTMNGITQKHSELLRDVVSTRTDIYRERGALEANAYLRTTLFAALADGDSYPSGPHCWGVECHAVDMVALALQREQLFAEAYVAYKARTPFTQVPPRRIEAQNPVLDDEWASTVMDYANSVWAESCRTKVRIDITTSRILLNALHIPLWQQEMTQKWRVAGILRAAGWVQKRDKSRYWRPVIRHRA